MNESTRSAVDIPPIAAIFIGSTWVTIRPRVWSVLPETVRARIRCIRYQPDSYFESAFVEELRQALDALAQLLETGDFGISVLFIADLHKPSAEYTFAPILNRALPPNVSCTPLWLGLHAPFADSAAISVSTILLSTTWRGARVQGGALEDAYRTLVLCLLATARSRFHETNFDTFSGIRSGTCVRRLLCSVESTAIGNFRQQAEERLQASVAAHYFPLISKLAARVAREHTPIDPTRLLHSGAANTLLELQVAEPLLCAAISDSGCVEAVCERLSEWQRRSSEPVRKLLTEWILTFSRWQDESETQASEHAAADLATPLFEVCPFPPLCRFTGRLASQKVRAAWETSIERVSHDLAAETRAHLDAEQYEFLPSDLGPAQRARSIATAFGATEFKNAFVTRHFPEELLRDLRDEVLLVSGRSVALYWLNAA